MSIVIKPYFTLDHSISQNEIDKAERKPWILHLLLENGDKEKNLKFFLQKAKEIVKDLNSNPKAQAKLIPTSLKNLINIRFEASDKEFEEIEKRSSCAK